MQANGEHRRSMREQENCRDDALSMPSGLCKNLRLRRLQTRPRRRFQRESSESQHTAPPSGLPSTSGRHGGCRPRFGPDGYLWIGTGDAASGTNAQNLAARKDAFARYM